MEYLTDPSQAELRPRAASLLGQMGADANAAAPALREALKDRDLFVRRAAAGRLPKVDPEIAAKANVP